MKKTYTRRGRALRHLGALFLLLALLQVTALYPILPRVALYARDRGKVVVAVWRWERGEGLLREYLRDKDGELNYAAAGFSLLTGWQRVGARAEPQTEAPGTIVIAQGRLLGHLGIFVGRVDHPKGELVRIWLDRSAHPAILDIPRSEWVTKNGKAYFLAANPGDRDLCVRYSYHAQLLDHRGQVLWEGDF